MHLFKDRLGRVHVDLRYRASTEPKHTQQMGTAEFPSRAADQVEWIANFLQVHGDALGHIGDLAHGTNQQRRGNRNRLPLASGVDPSEFIVEAILAADEGRLPRDRHIVTSQRGADQRSERLGAIGVSPTEVVQDGQPLGSAPTETALRTASSIALAAMW